MKTVFYIVAMAAIFVAFVSPVSAEPFKVVNPLGVDDLEGVVGKIADNLIIVATPVAVLMYIWAGIQFMISRGNPAGITKAKNIMLYTSIGLAIILIGSGFVTLIKSILSLG